MSEEKNHELAYQLLCASKQFQGCEDSALRELAQHFEEVQLKSGEVLLRKGDLGSDFYIIAYGRLQVRREIDGGLGYERDLGAGESVGEVSVLVEAPRTATVVAVRDSLLLRVSKTEFDRVGKQYPEMPLQLAKLALHRLTEPPHWTPEKEAKTIALVALSDAPYVMQFALELAEELEGGVVLDRAYVEKRFDLNLHRRAALSWLSERELHYRHVTYITDSRDDVWSRLCLRQADLVIWLADHKDTPSKKPIEFSEPTHELQTRQQVLLLLHEEANGEIRDTGQWIGPRGIRHFYHIRPGWRPHRERALRVLRGRTVGLVLSGGGARGAAHLGLIRALEENNIPIDVIGGTSMGAIVSAFRGLGESTEALYDILPQAMQEGGRLDLTFPFVSVLRGRRLEKALRTYAGEATMIEDLPRRMFCVSTNLTRSELVVNRSGLLWRALRSSVSLPGIYPPVFDETGLLIDGGALDNLPVRSMRQEMRAGTVIGCLTEATGQLPPYSRSDTSISGWRALWAHFNPLTTERSTYPGIRELLTHSLDLQELSRRREHKELADYLITMNLNDYGMMDYKRMKSIIDEGYAQAIEYLKNIDIKF